MQASLPRFRAYDSHKRGELAVRNRSMSLYLTLYLTQHGDASDYSRFDLWLLVHISLI